ncbi:MAG: hypothetical protein HKM07_02430 [Chlamydiae bacterium]|nr:hypothetical protein [Chlamydiota bacterium]
MQTKHLKQLIFCINPIKFGLFLLLCLLPFSGHSYEGEEEVNKILSELPDITSPTPEEYAQLEEFLRVGDRPYLDAFTKLKAPHPLPPPLPLTKDIGWHKNCRTLKLIGYKNEPPIYEVHHLNSSPHDKSRCVVLYGSYNDSYPQSVKKVLEGLKKIQFSGHVILRIGGYPNLQFGGLKLCHIPYAWKVSAIMEAKNLGYKSIVWLDARMYPITNIDTIFKVTEYLGYFLFTNNTTLDDLLRENLVESEVLKALRVANPKAVNHILGDVIGINSEDAAASSFLTDWMNETEKVIPTLSLEPDEICLSALAYKHNLTRTIQYDPMVLPATQRKLRNQFIPFTVHFIKQNIQNEWVE